LKDKGRSGYRLKSPVASKSSKIKKWVYANRDKRINKSTGRAHNEKKGILPFHTGCKQLASARGGALLNALDTAALEHGLVTTAGVVSHTGVGGFTLGGGFGRLNRKYGLTIDNLVSAELVTADGQIRTVSAGQNEDLFWAIR
jgi:hypothetical protein